MHRAKVSMPAHALRGQGRIRQLRRRAEYT